MPTTESVNEQSKKQVKLSLWRGIDYKRKERKKREVVQKKEETKSATGLKDGNVMKHTKGHSTPYLL